MGAADLCLSRREIAELCRTPQRARQVAFLHRNGIRHYLDAHGWPVVLRSAVDGAQAMNQARAAGAVGISLRLGVTGRLRGEIVQRLAQCLFERLHASGQVA